MATIFVTLTFDPTFFHANHSVGVERQDKAPEHGVVYVYIYSHANISSTKNTEIVTTSRFCFTYNYYYNNYN